MPAKVKSAGLLSIAVLGSGNVFGTIISAIALILFSRFMGPAEFGIFSAALAAMQILVRLTDLGTNVATERQLARVYGGDRTLADRLARVGLWMKGLGFVVFAGLGWVLAPWIGHSLLHIGNISIIRLAFLLSAGTVLFEYTTVIFQASHRFGMVARITIAQAIGKLVFGLLLIWQGMLQSFSALLIYGLMPGVGALLGWIKTPLSSFSLPKSWRHDAKLILSIAKWTGIATVAATLADNIDTLFVQSLMSSYNTGIWSGAVRIATFGSLVGWSIGSVLSIRVARYADHSHLKKYLSKAWKLSIFSFLLLCLAIPLAGFAIWVTIGTAYTAAITPLQILLLATGIGAATTPYVSLFYLFDKPQYYAYAGIISTAILLIGDYATIPYFGLLGAAWTRVVVRLFVLIFTLLYARRAYVKHLHQK